MSKRIKQAAVFLHSLSIDDRQWILNRISFQKKNELELALQELDGIVIPHEVLNQAKSIIIKEAKETTSKSKCDNILDSADISDLAKVLSTETDTYIATLLNQGDWGWKGEYLATLSPAKQKAILLLTKEIKGNQSETLKSRVYNQTATALTRVSGKDNVDRNSYTGANSFEKEMSIQQQAMSA